MTTLRDYQSRAIRLAREAYPDPSVVVLPTGAGKGVLFGHLINSARAKGRRVLSVSHRRELVYQQAEHIGDCGFILSGEKPRDNPIQVASIQTLMCREIPKVDIIHIQEAHHARSVSYETLVASARGALVIGDTATPVRLDGLGLGRVFKRIIETTTVRQLIDDGWLADFDYLAPDRPSMKGVRKDRGDYVAKQAEERMEGLFGSIEQHHRQHCRDVPTLVFATSVAHSMALAEKLGGVHVDARTPTKARKAAFDGLRSGSVHTVCNVNIVTEGFDCPDLGAVVLARPTASLGLHRQMVGRALRPMQGRALILDHAGNVFRHGLPDEEIEWSLEDRKTRRKEVKSYRTCLGCYAILDPSARVCPRCGAAPPAPKPKPLPKEREGRLKKYQRVRGRMPPAMQDTFRSLCIEARENGYRLGWARMRFKQRMGRWAWGTQDIETQEFSRCTHVRVEGGECRFCRAEVGTVAPQSQTRRSAAGGLFG